MTRARKTGMFLFACTVIPIVFTTRVGDWPAVLLIGLAGASHQAWSANLFTTTSDIFPKKDIGTITGLGGMAGSLGGTADLGATVVSLPVNLGYGAAVQTGFRYAVTHGYDLGLVMDADGQHDP